MSGRGLHLGVDGESNGEEGTTTVQVPGLVEFGATRMRSAEALTFEEVANVLSMVYMGQHFVGEGSRALN